MSPNVLTRQQILQLRAHQSALNELQIHIDALKDAGIDTSEYELRREHMLKTMQMLEQHYGKPKA